MFRDWAENIILDKLTPPERMLPAIQRRSHNRLSPERLLSILADVCRIEDSALRNSLADKLMNP